MPAANSMINQGIPVFLLYFRGYPEPQGHDRSPYRVLTNNSIDRYIWTNSSYLINNEIFMPSDPNRWSNLVYPFSSQIACTMNGKDGAATEGEEFTVVDGAKRKVVLRRNLVLRYLVCQLCNQRFSNLDDLKNHKFENHAY